MFVFLVEKYMPAFPVFSSDCECLYQMSVKIFGCWYIRSIRNAGTTGGGGFQAPSAIYFNVYLT